MTTIALATTVKTADSTIKTVTAAERFIVKTTVDINWYGPKHPDVRTWVGDLGKVQAALAEMTGESLIEISTRLAATIHRSHARRTAESAKMARKLGLI